MITLICVFIFSLLLKKQKEKIDFYEIELYKANQKTKEINKRLDNLYENLKDEKLKEYIRDCFDSIYFDAKLH